MNFKNIVWFIKAVLKCVFIKVRYFSDFFTYFFQVLLINVKGLHRKMYQMNVIYGKGLNGPFFLFLVAISDCNAGFLQWFSLAETSNYKVSEILGSDQQFAITVLPSTNNQA